MYSYIFIIGLSLLLAGFTLLIAYGFVNSGNSNSTGNNSSSKSSFAVGGVVMLGPIPIVFGSSPAIAVAAMALALALLIVAIIFFFLFARR